MGIDLTHPYREGYNNLQTWRSRYSKTEYPFKIVQNIFYRQYTMNFIWDAEVDASFSKYSGSENDILNAYQKLEFQYSSAAPYLTEGNRLIDLMNKKEDVGGLNYSNNIPLIAKGQSGDNTAIEELEFTYLYYLLANKATLMWAAFGRKGFSKIDAIAQLTGAVIEYSKPIGYADILNVLGRLGVAPSINALYTPLPGLN